MTTKCLHCLEALHVSISTGICYSTECKETQYRRLYRLFDTDYYGVCAYWDGEYPPPVLAPVYVWQAIQDGYIACFGV